ncbi:MAG: LysR family transcriptional regulator [Granulosicoccus sp.]
MALYPDIRDLQLLMALSQRKHFTRAANDCGISQPAFSARIRHLEDELGVPIVRRGNKFLGFTKDGELVLKWASKILANSEGLLQDIEISKGALRGTLVLGVVPTALTYAASISTVLRDRFPDLAIQIQSLTSVQITRGLTDFSIDAGFTYDDVDKSSLSFEAIYDEHYVLLTPAAMAPRKQGEASWEEVAKLPLCLLSKDMHFRQIIDSLFEQAHVQPQPVMETNAFTAALAQVATGSAATIAPEALVKSLLLDESTSCLKLSSPVVGHSIGLAVLDHEPVLPAITVLREAIRSHHK